LALGRSGTTYRPRSSVTTIFTNLVGRSEVSAITQTPASGPDAPVTTPPRSSLSIATVAAGCWPRIDVAEVKRRSASPAAVTLPYNTCVAFMAAPRYVVSAFPPSREATADPPKPWRRWAGGPQRPAEAGHYGLTDYLRDGDPVYIRQPHVAA